MKRREVIRSIAAVAAFSPTVSQAKKSPTIEDCHENADNVAAMMKQCVGGQWRVSMDKNLDFILISKVL